MYKNIELKITVIAEIIQIVLFKIALTEGVRVLYYIHQRRVSFVLFIIIAFIAGRQNKYFSCAIAILGMLIFNPIYKVKFTGPQWDLVEWCLIGICTLGVFIDLYNLNKIRKKGIGLLRALKRNRKTGQYEVEDASIRYEIQPTLIKNLKKFMNKSDLGSMQRWYSILSQEDKEKVARVPLHGTLEN